MGYEDDFTADNRRVLREVDAEGISLRNKTGEGVTRRIEWTQIARALFGCAENYKEVSVKERGADVRLAGTLWA